MPPSSRSRISLGIGRRRGRRCRCPAARPSRTSCAGSSARRTRRRERSRHPLGVEREVGDHVGAAPAGQEGRAPTSRRRGSRRRCAPAARPRRRAGRRRRAVGGRGRGSWRPSNTTGPAGPPSSTGEAAACAALHIGSGLSVGRVRLAPAASGGRTCVRTPTPDHPDDQPEEASGRPAHHPGCPRAQPQGHLARPAARLPDRVHRAVRLGQVQPGVRHDLRRGPAPLRRVAVGVRPPVPRPDGQARRRLHRGPVAGGLDRPEVHVEEPPLHRRHHHRGLRLPPPALRPRRPAPLPGLRRPDRAADAAADRRPRARPRGGPPLPGAGPGHPRPQGGVRRALPAAPDRRLLPGPGRRRHPHPRRPAEARQAEEAHHRGGRRPAGGEGVVQAPADRLGRDRAAPGQRAGGPRLRRPAGQGPRPRDEVLRADGLPQRPHHRHRRARAALVLLQLARSAPAPSATASARGWRSTPTWSSPTPRRPSARARSSRGARPTSPTTSCA